MATCQVGHREAGSGPTEQAAGTTVRCCGRLGARSSSNAQAVTTDLAVLLLGTHPGDTKTRVHTNLHPGVRGQRVGTPSVHRRVKDTRRARPHGGVSLGHERGRR